MKDYTYSVTLSIKHNTVSPEKITDELGILPIHTGIKGDRFSTKSGRVLNRVNEMNFWRAELADKKPSEEISLEEFLSDQNRRLLSSKGFLNQIQKTGGHIEYFIGWFAGDYNMILSLESKILKETGELGIAIGLHAYAERRP